MVYAEQVTYIIQVIHNADANPAPNQYHVNHEQRLRTSPRYSMSQKLPSPGDRRGDMAAGPGPATYAIMPQSAPSVSLTPRRTTKQGEPQLVYILPRYLLHLTPICNQVYFQDFRLLRPTSMRLRGDRPTRGDSQGLQPA